MKISCHGRSALHLLLASFCRVAGQLQESGEQQLRRSLLARAVTTVVAASSACLGSFPLPDDSDAGFWVKIFRVPGSRDSPVHLDFTPTGASMSSWRTFVKFAGAKHSCT